MDDRQLRLIKSREIVANRQIPPFAVKAPGDAQKNRNGVMKFKKRCY